MKHSSYIVVTIVLLFTLWCSKLLITMEKPEGFFTNILQKISRASTGARAVIGAGSVIKEFNSTMSKAIRIYLENQNLYKIYKTMLVLQEDLLLLQEKKPSRYSTATRIMEKIEACKTCNLNLFEKSLISIKSTPTTYTKQLENLTQLLTNISILLNQKQVLLKTFYLGHLFAQFIKNIDGLPKIAGYFININDPINLLQNNLVQCFTRMENAINMLTGQESWQDIENMILNTPIKKQDSTEKSPIKTFKQPSTPPSFFDRASRAVSFVRSLPDWALAGINFGSLTTKYRAETEQFMANFIKNLNHAVNKINLKFNDIENEWKKFVQNDYNQKVQDLLNAPNPHDALLAVNENAILVLKFLTPTISNFGLILRQLANICLLVHNFMKKINDQIIYASSEDLGKSIDEKIINTIEKIQNSLYQLDAQIGTIEMPGKWLAETFISTEKLATQEYKESESNPDEEFDQNIDTTEKNN